MAEEAGANPVEEAADELDARIRAEIASMVQAVRELAARARRLGVGGRGVNGLAAATAVWSRELENTADKVELEGPAVSKALLGKETVEIVTHVNSELAAAVASDPERKR